MPTMLKIEKHVPLYRQRQDRLTALLKKMKNGDSVMLPLDTPTERNAWYQAAHRLGMKVSIRRMEDGARVWRVK